MANRFWVGGTATWNGTAGTKWATTSGGAGGASAPTAADDVFFDANDGAAGAAVVTLNSASVARSINCTGFTGTLSHPASTNLAIGDATAGASNIALKFVAGMTYTLGNGQTSSISFISTSATVQTIDFGGKTTAQVTYNGVGGSWQLVAGHTQSSNATVFVTNGTLDTNGQTCSWGFLSSSNSNVRTITLGASAITLTGSPGTGIDFATSTNLTFNAGTSNITWNVTNTYSFNGGGKTFYNVTINLPAGVGTTGWSGNNTFNNLTFNAPTGSYNWFQPNSGTTQTINGTFTVNGSNADRRIWVKAGTPGSAATLNAAAVSLQNADFMDIAAGGAATWSGTSLGDGGGNSGITFTTARTLYRVGAGGNWNDTSKWSLSSGGATGVPAPLCQDDVFIDANATGTVSAGGLTTDSPLGKNIDTTGFVGTLSLGGLGNLRIFGSMKLVAGLTMGGGESWKFSGRGSYQLTSAGKTIAGISHEAPGGTLTLQDALSLSGNLNLNAGTFTSNNFAMTMSSLQSTGTTMTVVVNFGTSTVNLTLTSASNIIDIRGSANITWNISNSAIVIANASANQRVINASLGDITFGDLYYNVAGSSGILLIQSGNHSFNDIYLNDTGTARTLKFKNGATHTIRGQLYAKGASGVLHTISSTTAASAATLTKSSGTINCDYLNIQDITATGGARWFAGANSVNVSGNTGWIFTAANYAITKALQYAVKRTPTAPTKSLQYMIKKGISITKQLKYLVKAASQIGQAPINQNGDFTSLPTLVAPQTGGGWVDGTATGSGTNTYRWNASMNGVGSSTQFDTISPFSDPTKGSIKLHAQAGSAAIMEIRNDATGYFSGDVMTLKPNTTYRISGWIRAANVTGSAASGAHIQFMTQDGAGNSTGEVGVSPNITANQGWTRYELYYKTGASAAKGHVELRVYAHTGAATLGGDFWFAGIRVEEAIGIRPLKYAIRIPWGPYQKKAEFVQGIQDSVAGVTFVDLTLTGVQAGNAIIVGVVAPNANSVSVFDPNTGSRVYVKNYAISNGATGTFHSWWATTNLAVGGSITVRVSFSGTVANAHAFMREYKNIKTQNGAVGGGGLDTSIIHHSNYDNSGPTGAPAPSVVASEGDMMIFMTENPNSALVNSGDKENFVRSPGVNSWRAAIMDQAAPKGPELTFQTGNFVLGSSVVQFSTAISYISTTDNTRSPLQKSLQYAIKKATAITESLRYTIRKSPAITKALQYDVKTVKQITKALQYYVRKPIAITKSMRYTVKKVLSITKSLRYTIRLSPGIAKSLRYAVKVTRAITKVFGYKILIPQRSRRPTVLRSKRDVTTLK